jgi:sirohydrochlorin ferrochelatase
MTAYVVFAHGSSIASANDAVRQVARDVAARGNLALVSEAFLEGGAPSLADAIHCLAHQADHVIVVPYFLTLGLHLQRDLPRLINDVRAAHPHLRIDVAAPLDQHPSMIDALLDRANEALCKPS